MEESKDEPSEDMELIDTSKKPTKQRKAPTMPQVGKKRLRGSSKKAKQEESYVSEADPS